MIPLVQPAWAAPSAVRAFTTTRQGGTSLAPYDSLNLGLRCGDDSAAVAENRRRFGELLPSVPGWIRQVHGARVLPRESITGNSNAEVEADAVVCSSPGLACTVLTADCLPVLFCDTGAGAVGVAHAGWRGLVAGVLEATVAAMPSEPGRLLAWLGPAISARAYEVGEDLRVAVLERYPVPAAFETRDGRLYADLYAIARTALTRAGVSVITGGAHCTYTDSDRFFSYRRDGATGRMATTIWLDNLAP